MKKLYVVFAFVLVAAIATMAFAPFGKTGCLPPGSYLFAQKDEEIYWAKMDSGLTSNKGNFNIGITGISPDDKIAVSRCSLYLSLIEPRKQAELYRVPVKGGWINQLTNTPNMSETGPFVSPDAAHILFTVWDPSSQPNVGIIDRSGANYQILIKNALAPSNYAENEPAVHKISQWGAMGFKFAENMRSIALRPEGNLVALVTAQGDLIAVPVDGNWIPVSNPIEVMTGYNLNYATWANIP